MMPLLETITNSLNYIDLSEIAEKKLFMQSNAIMPFAG